MGGQLPFQVAGDGPAVVFLHGGLGDARMSDDQWPAFTRRDRTVRYDLVARVLHMERPDEFDRLVLDFLAGVAPA